MGRLINNANIVCIILIPNLIKAIFPETDFNVVRVVKQDKIVGGVYILLILGAFVILMAQLLRQSGYTPYMSILNHLELLKI